MTREEIRQLLACALCGLPCPKNEITYCAKRFCSIDCASAFIDQDEEGDWLDRPLTTRERAAVSKAAEMPGVDELDRLAAAKDVQPVTTYMTSDGASPSSGDDRVAEAIRFLSYAEERLHSAGEEPTENRTYGDILCALAQLRLVPSLVQGEEPKP